MTSVFLVAVPFVALLTLVLTVLTRQAIRAEQHDLEVRAARRTGPTAREAAARAALYTLPDRRRHVPDRAPAEMLRAA